jgi:tetratricopeptide (TPR) repeat protein
VRRVRGVVRALLVAAAAACTNDKSDAVPLYQNLGSHHKTVSTSDPLAQQYFDQGLRLVYAFNHDEAIRSFTRATELDPQCAMCHWGIALALGPHINAEMEPERAAKAFAASQRALALASSVTAQERDYIQALAARYGAVQLSDQAQLDSAYARAMSRVAQRYPTDLDAATLYAEALMNLRPGAYWTSDGTPNEGTQEIVQTLERVIQRNPNHPGACHYYIHAVEAAHPERALRCAQRLPSLIPGAGHIVHMPAHIYVRTGRWTEAIAANEHAIHADERFLENATTNGLYRVGYYAHNFHFLAWAAMMAGRSAKASEAARALGSKIDLEMARAAIDAQDLVAYEVLALTRFGKWQSVLAAPTPPNQLRFAFAMSQYARGIALAALGRSGDAWPALDTLGTIAAELSDQLHRNLVTIAMYALMGEMALRSGDTEAAIASFREAVRLEDGFLYSEPPRWYYPVRHSLGAALLEAGRSREAERIYRQDLTRFPNNGWSLFGLAAALRAQRKNAQAIAVENQFREAWRGADVTLTASKF